MHPLVPVVFAIYPVAIWAIYSQAWWLVGALAFITLVLDVKIIRDAIG